MPQQKFAKNKNKKMKWTILRGPTVEYQEMKKQWIWEKKEECE